MPEYILDQCNPAVPPRHRNERYRYLHNNVHVRIGCVKLNLAYAHILQMRTKAFICAMESKNDCCLKSLGQLL
jgi:hypothetical protein